MAKKKVVSFKELKENFCLETLKRDFLDFDCAKNNFDNYLKTHKQGDLRQLVNSVKIKCNSYFEGYICTNDMWNLDFDYASYSLHLTYKIYTVINNHLNTKDYISAFLNEENGIYILECHQFNAMTHNEKEAKQLNHDMEVGRFMLQCCVDLLNNLLQEQEVK
ncbi:hypothetical protein MKC79_09685 [[Clostridium] innocuum]|nr:hypothetical protein [[Clostridium] innocuum]